MKDLFWLAILVFQSMVLGLMILGQCWSRISWWGAYGRVEELTKWHDSCEDERKGQWAKYTHNTYLLTMIYLSSSWVQPSSIATTHQKTIKLRTHEWTYPMMSQGHRYLISLQHCCTEDQAFSWRAFGMGSDIQFPKHNKYHVTYVITMYVNRNEE